VTVATDPLALAGDVQRATDRLLATARGLDDAAIAGPSLLPGWSRGHVLAHVARNADGAVNLLNWARTGVRTPQYESLDSRAADIDADAARSAAEHLRDLLDSGERFAAAVRDMPAAAWTAVVEWTSGTKSPAARVMWSRLREVEIHHVDLGAGYGPADWPEAFTLRMIRSLAQDFGARTDAPRAVLRSPEVSHDLVLGAEGEAAGPVVSGPAAAIVAWLIGRSGGHALSVEPEGPLPAVPDWG
jgi:maleylpyruvate isomerase